MSRTLCIKSSGLPEVHNKPWSLVLRKHDLSGTDYETIALLDDSTAREVIEAGAASWLYGEPDWDNRYRLRELERARVLREQAADKAVRTPKDMGLIRLTPLPIRAIFRSWKREILP